MTMWFHLRRLAVAALFAAAPGVAFAADEWQAQVGEALGKTGTTTPSGIYRVGLPRTDLKVTLDGVELKAGFALGSWLAFEKMGDQGMVMGDLVLTEAEVNPVMTKLAAGGIDVTALHNHLLRNQPFTMYMHVLGHGDPVKLAAVLHTALAESKTPLSAAPAAPASAPPQIDLDTATIDQTLGAKGTNNSGVYQFSIPRAEPIKDRTLNLRRNLLVSKLHILPTKVTTSSGMLRTIGCEKPLRAASSSASRSVLPLPTTVCSSSGLSATQRPLYSS
jgi:uncharacterized protein DUF1259